MTGLPKSMRQYSMHVLMMRFAMIKQLGSGCFLAKTDIKSAFRIIPIKPSDYDLLGIFWQGQYYY